MRTEMIGMIETYFVNRKYGFIVDKIGGSHFFHRSNYNGAGEPQLGEQVSFELTAPNSLGKRPQATRITRIAQEGGEAVKS